MVPGCLLLAASSLVSAVIAELGSRALGQRPLALQSDRKIFWTYDPVLGWHHRPGQTGVFELVAPKGRQRTVSDVRVEVSLNRNGLRDLDYPLRRVAGKKRVLVAGDSFVWGFGVAQGEIFTERMEAALRDVEVINAGVSGYSTDQELLWLRNEGMKYRPDLVILVVSGNDDAMNHRRVAYFVYPKPAFDLVDGGALELRNVPVPRASVLRRLAHLGCSRSALVNLAVGRSAGAIRGMRQPAPGGAERAEPTEPFALTAALVDEIRKLAAAGGARLLVVTTGMFWPADSAGTYQQLIARLRRQGHEVLDVEAAAGFAGERMRLPNDGHWNGEGHAFVAARVIEHIDRRRLLEPPPGH